MTDVTTIERTSSPEQGKKPVHFPIYDAYDRNVDMQDPDRESLYTRSRYYNTVFRTLEYTALLSGQLSEDVEHIAFSEISVRSKDIVNLACSLRDAIQWLDRPDLYPQGEDAINHIQEHIQKFSDSNNSDTTPTGDIKDIEDDEEFILMSLSSLGHDINTNITPVYSYINNDKTFDDSLRSMFKTKFIQISETVIDTGSTVRKKELGKQIYSVESLSELVRNVLRSNYSPKLSHLMPGLLESDGNKQVIFNQTELKRIVINLIRNAEKIYDDIHGTPDEDNDFDLPIDEDVNYFGCIVRLVQGEGNSEYMEIIFDDHAKGYPADIVSTGHFPDKTGFQKQKNKGTGKGLRYHQKVVETFFNGKLIPTLNEEGGARTILRLPISSTM